MNTTVTHKPGQQTFLNYRTVKEKNSSTGQNKTKENEFIRQVDTAKDPKQQQDIFQCILQCQIHMH